MTKRIWIILVILIVAGGGMYLYLKASKGSATDKNRGSETSNEVSFTNPDLKSRYEDKDFGFFVDYPDSFKATPQDQEDIRTVVFDKKEGTTASESFQIFAMPFDEEGPITRERILIDQPDMIIKDPQEVEIGGEKALVFLGNDADIGDTREVWFVHGSYLFQASTYAKNDELLAKVMKTFRFK